MRFLVRFSPLALQLLLSFSYAANCLSQSLFQASVPNSIKLCEESAEVLLLCDVVDLRVSNHCSQGILYMSNQMRRAAKDKLEGKMNIHLHVYGDSPCHHFINVTAVAQMNHQTSQGIERKKIFA